VSPLTHVGALCTIFEANVTASGLRATATFGPSLIRRKVTNEGLPPEVFGEVVAGELVLAEASGPSVLGCMNDVALFGFAIIDQSSGLTHTNLGIGPIVAISLAPANTSGR
jgi:hypothetical protein